LLWAELASEYTKIDRYGNARTLNSFNWFTSLNYWYYEENESILSVPVVPVLPPALPFFTGVISLNSILITWADFIDVALNTVVVYASAPVTNTSTVLSAKYRRLDITGLDCENSFDIYHAWCEAFGLDSNDMVGNSNCFINVQVFTYVKATGVTGVAVSLPISFS
jgi:hypothetical protein